MKILSTTSVLIAIVTSALIFIYDLPILEKTFFSGTLFVVWFTSVWLASFSLLLSKDRILWMKKFDQDVKPAHKTDTTEKEAYFKELISTTSLYFFFLSISIGVFVWCNGWWKISCTFSLFGVLIAGYCLSDYFPKIKDVAEKRDPLNFHFSIWMFYVPFICTLALYLVGADGYYAVSIIVFMAIISHISLKLELNETESFTEKKPNLVDSKD